MLEGLINIVLIAALGLFILYSAKDFENKFKNK